ncbi:MULTISPECIES: hypothetical protein [unclassified Pseudonocardia]|uniref:hypothetical protein n=1 Tax=Pseudonocardia sp. Ae150A_Ps1 TaxID=1885028 RepID=UPI00094B6165|nr:MULTISPECIES: hypothetical protein [unclassified Pseudonocardia]
MPAGGDLGQVEHRPAGLGEQGPAQRRRRARDGRIDEHVRPVRDPGPDRDQDRPPPARTVRVSAAPATARPSRRTTTSRSAPGLP